MKVSELIVGKHYEEIESAPFDVMKYEGNVKGEHHFRSILAPNYAWGCSDKQVEEWLKESIK